MSGGCQKVTVTGRVNHATRENVLVDEACQAAVTRRVKHARDENLLTCKG